MDHHIGLDVHSASCTAGVLSAKRKWLGRTEEHWERPLLFQGRRCALAGGHQKTDETVVTMTRKSWFMRQVGKVTLGEIEVVDSAVGYPETRCTANHK